MSYSTYRGQWLTSEWLSSPSAGRSSSCSWSSQTSESCRWVRPAFGRLWPQLEPDLPGPPLWDLHSFLLSEPPQGVWAVRRWDSLQPCWASEAGGWWPECLQGHTAAAASASGCCSCCSARQAPNLPLHWLHLWWISDQGRGKKNRFIRSFFILLLCSWWHLKLMENK